MKEGFSTHAVMLLAPEPAEAEQLRNELAAAAERIPCRVVRNADEVIARCREGMCLLLVPLFADAKRKLAIISELRALGVGCAVVAVIREGNETAGAEAVRRGAKGYVLQSELSGSSLRRLLEAARGARPGPAEAGDDFHELIHVSPDGVVVVDSSGVVRYANPASERLFGTKATKLVGSQFGRPVVSGEVTELVIPSRKGSRSHVEMRVAEVLWKGEPARVALLRDITERKQLELELRRLNDELAARVAEVARLRSALEEENRNLREILRAERPFEELVGESPAMRRLLAQVRAVAPTDTTVLIQGETGTGKGVVARLIHQLSLRSHRPLVTVNCAGLAPGLIESEFFGHEKGAFTGAVTRRAGRFELADGGAIFLDEIGDLPPDLQVKLLAVLQEGQFERVGGNRTLKVDVRVIAATNRDLAEAVRMGKFRQDLYYRLNVFPITVPPLRERKEDVPLLVDYFVRRIAGRLGKRLRGVTREGMGRLMEYDWPGNVRELQHVIERAAILSEGPYLEITELQEGSLAGGGPRPARLADVQREHILRVLEKTNWVIEGPRGAATLLGLHPNTLRYRMRKLGIQRPRREMLE